MAAIALFLRSLRRQRVFRDRRNPIDFFEDSELYAAFRFRRHDILALCDELTPDIEYLASRQGALPPVLQVLLCLRFYATGTFQSTVGELIGVSKATASRTIARVTNAITKQLGDWIHLPTQPEADAQKVKFYAKAKFPGVVGCIDGTQVRIQAPVLNEHEYVNRKNFHAINVQVVCDADLKVINCVVKWPGSAHDARILRESSLYAAFEGRPKLLSGVLLGDSGYMQRDWLMTPIINTRHVNDELYNQSLCNTRSTGERCIGVIKRRWHCLHTELRVAPAKACKIITACLILHNRAVAACGGEDGQDSDDDDEASSNGGACSDWDVTTQDVFSSDSATERVRAAAGKACRDRLIGSFFSC